MNQCYRVAYGGSKDHFVSLDAAMKFVKELYEFLPNGMQIFISVAEYGDVCTVELKDLKFELMSFFTVVHNNPQPKSNNNIGSRPIPERQKTPLELSFDVMGLPYNSQRAIVKSTFKKLAKVHHPDTGGSPENFIKINESYQYILSCKGWK